MQILGHLALAASLLGLAFAPIYQFYLAWIALVPWLLVIHRVSTTRRAFLLSWLAGIFFFAVKLWWITPITAPGMVALVIYCGFYWAASAWIIRGCRLTHLHPVVAVLAIATVWTALEFVRANILTGFPLVFVGNSQSPLLPVCQIADTLGAWGVTFWVLMLNALGALIIIRGFSRAMAPAIALVAACTTFTMGYGIWRMNQSVSSPGPNVLVVQTNDPQTNKGEKPKSYAELLALHLNATAGGIMREKEHVDLAVWSETILPQLNQESRYELGVVLHASVADDITMALTQVPAFAIAHQIAILTGARYSDHFGTARRDGDLIWVANTRNSAYLFQRDGTMKDGVGERYDKIHLVPFGEYIPFKHTVPILYKLFINLGPDYYSDYELQDGSDNGLTVFHLDNPENKTWRFVTPICFEDLDARLCSAMFRPDADGQKRADFMVNITNDGWFPGDENSLQLQSATFRCIENRAPMARSVNTGISGFTDACGRPVNQLPVRTEGTAAARLNLDSRVTIYTRWGDWFAWCCVIFTLGITLRSIVVRYFPRPTHEQPQL